MASEHHTAATCAFLKKEYGISPLQSWGELSDPVLMKWWDDHNCNDLSAQAPAALEERGEHSEKKLQTTVYLESWFDLPRAAVQGIDRVAVAFGGFGDDGSIYEPSGMDNLPPLRALLKPTAKILLSVGGWGSAASFWRVIGNPGLRARAAASVKFLLGKGWDGFDFDWEYPQTDQIGGFVEFLEGLRRDFPTAILTIAASANDGYYSGYLGRLSTTLDSIYLMTYDFAGPWSSRTGHNSSVFDGVDTVNRFIAGGADPAKLVLGSAFYGRSVSVRESTINGLGVLTVGDWKDETYKEVLGLLAQGGYVRSWDKDRCAPTLFNRTSSRFVTYEDAETIALKRDAAAKRGLQGVFAWSFHQDDGTLIKALCGAK